MKKLFSILTVILLLAALSIPVCALEWPEDPMDLQRDLREAYWRTYVVTPLSAEMKQEIEDTWPDKNYPIAIYDIFYYGEYNGAHVFLDPLPIADSTWIEVGGYVLEWSSAFYVHVYRNGEFLNIQEAYAKEWLTEQDLSKISLLAESSNHWDEEYYGEYDGCHVAFIYGGPFNYPAEEMLYTIGGYTFRYPDHHQLDVYKDGQMMNLEKAYEAGWLSDAAVARLWNYYTNGVYENPNTGDGVWMPVALLMASGAALLMIISRKRTR